MAVVCDLFPAGLVQLVAKVDFVDSGAKACRNGRLYIPVSWGLGSAAAVVATAFTSRALTVGRSARTASLPASCGSWAALSGDLICLGSPVRRSDLPGHC